MKASDCWLFGSGIAFVCTVPCSRCTHLSLWFTVPVGRRWKCPSLFCSRARMKNNWYAKLSYSALSYEHLTVLFSGPSDYKDENVLVTAGCTSLYMWAIVPTRCKNESGEKFLQRPYGIKMDLRSLNTTICHQLLNVYQLQVFFYIVFAPAFSSALFFGSENCCSISGLLVAVIATQSIIWSICMIMNSMQNAKSLPLLAINLG